MGNHQAGRAMGLTAVSLLTTRTNQTALELLDTICAPYRGCDAEFESEDPANPGHIHPEYSSYTDPDGPIGALIIEAFGEGRDWKADYLAATSEEAADTFWDEWWSYPDGGPYGQFRARYKFC